MTYEWKVDLALLVAVSNVVFTVISGIAQRWERRKSERLAAYDEVIHDVRDILLFPMKRNDERVEEQGYENQQDPELEAAVKKYLDLHWMESWLGLERLAPSRLTKRLDRLRFIQEVQREASEFRARQWDSRLSLNPLQLSPVSQFENPEIAERFAQVMRSLGRRLSACSPVVRELWVRAKTADAAETRRDYERALRVCPNYFEHNERDFADPFHDLLKRVQEEHRALTRTTRELIAGLKWAGRRSLLRLVRAMSAGLIL